MPRQTLELNVFALDQLLPRIIRMVMETLMLMSLLIACKW